MSRTKRGILKYKILLDAASTTVLSRGSKANDKESVGDSSLSADNGFSEKRTFFIVIAIMFEQHVNGKSFCAIPRAAKKRSQRQP